MADRPLYERIDLYETCEPWAELVKIGAQMLVGIGIFLALICTFLIPVGLEWAWLVTLLADKAPLAIVAYGLALSAGIELAYMLFTRGPDEAVEPLILGLASAILLIVSNRNGVGWEISLAVLVFVAAVGFLFYVRDVFVLNRTPKRKSTKKPDESANR